MHRGALDESSAARYAWVIVLELMRLPHTGGVGCAGGTDVGMVYGYCS
jgi:hypothetical protein